MPLLNSRGQVLAGIAGQQASVDGALMPVLGNAAWLDDDHVVGQSLDAAQLLLVPVAQPAAFTKLATHGASRVVAGAGRWASVLYTSPTQVDGALGQLLGPDLYAAGPDGTIAWKRDRQASSGVVLTGPTGSSIELSSANPTDLQVLSSTEAIWCEGPGQYRALGRAVLRPAVLTQRIRIVTVDGEDWLIVAGQDGGLVAHLDGETDGYILVPASGEADNHDARLVNGQIVVTWSVTMGERPLDVRTVTIDRAQPRVALAPAPIVSPPAQPSTLSSLPAHPRKLWIAPYWSFGRYGDAPKDDYLTYATAAVILGDERDPTVISADLARVYPLGMPLIVAETAQPVQPYIGNIVAWLASGATLQDLAASVARAAALPEKPILAYLDSGDLTAWPTTAPSWYSGRVWPSAQAYRQAGETVDAFQLRMTALLTRLANWGGYLSLVPRFDDVNGTQPVSFTTDCMDAYAELIQAFPICAVMPFADRRGHGISADPALKGWAQGFARANVSRPNRFDYWTPSTSTPAATLKNKLAQTVEMVVLSGVEKQFLLEKIS